MIRFGKILVIGLLVATVVPAFAAADTVSVTGQQIKITASVAPSRYVVIDASGTVQQIINNNYLANLTPRVYVGSVTAGNERALTPDINRQVRELLAGKTIKPGILYNRQLAVTPTFSASFFLQVKPVITASL